MAPFRYVRARFVANFAFEAALILTVLYGLAVLTTVLVAGSSRHDLAVPLWLASGLFVGILLFTRWNNSANRASLLRETAVFTAVSVLAGLASFTLVWFLSDLPQRMSALVLLEAAAIVPGSIALWRWLATRFGFFRIARDRILIVGTGERARALCRWIVDHRPTEYAVLGFADEDQSHLGSVMAMGIRIQTDYASLYQCAPGRVDRVIVALDEKRGKLPVQQLMQVRLRGIEVEEATSFLERVSGKISVETMLPSWLIFSSGFKTSRLRMVVKRLVDIAASSVLLILALPLMVLTAILIRLDSRGPVLFRQRRLAGADLEFNVLKFRSMREDAEAGVGPTWARENDPRTTRVGRVIRKLRIDELPQLINVLRGEMSLVGPRPERVHFVRQLEQRIPYYGLRFLVRPGVTGWAQVEYGYGATNEDALEKLKYELFYIKNGNLALDLWIILKTIKVVLLGRGAR